MDIEGDVLIKYTGEEKDIIIPDYIKIIREEAFQDNKFVETIVFPKSLIEIERRAFFGCENLKYAYLNVGLEKIGNRAFMNCPALLGSTNLDTLTFPRSLISIGMFSFYGDVGLTGDLIIPRGVRNIGFSAFEKCCNLDGWLMYTNDNILVSHPISGTKHFQDTHLLKLREEDDFSIEEEMGIVIREFIKRVNSVAKR